MQARPRSAGAPRTEPLERRFAQVRDVTLGLARPLSAEDCQVQSMPDASPVKWHLAHVTWFFETFLLERFESAFRPFDPSYRVLFNSYYQGVGEQSPRPRRGLILSPTLDEVRRYRAQVDERMLALLHQRGAEPEIAALVELGLHHEQQHQELILTDIKHALSFDARHAPYVPRWPIATVRPQPLRWFGFDGGLVEHGHDAALDGLFCFDNETPRHRTFLEPFELASRPVGNGEVIGFIEDGGYRRPELWLSAGWDWVRAGAREAPLYWERDGDGWANHTLHGRVRIDPHTPACHLNFYEADALARWAGARLPTEQEWEFAVRRGRGGTAPNLADRGIFHPMPQAQEAADGPLQMIGDVWEWTRSDYAPYPGYRPLPGAVGEYNGKFMCGQYVLRGGSCATPAGHVRASYRNFFPPDARWQFSGIRFAR